MEDFNQHRSKYTAGDENKTPYQPRKHKNSKETGNRKKWVIPIALLLIVVVGAGIFFIFGDSSRIGLSEWLSERFAPKEEKVQLAVPEALFIDKDIEEFISRAVEVQGVDEISRGDDGALIFTMTDEARKRMLEEAENNLEDKITAMSDEGQHPYFIDISYDGAYNNFYLLINLEQDDNDRAIYKASELFTLAVYYQYVKAAADPVREVSILIEDIETGSITEQLVYPDDLNRVAAILEHPMEPIETPTTPQAGDKVIVSTGPDNLNLRNGPEITYLIIDILSSGTILDVTGTEGVWLEVVTPGGMEGWVHGDFVEIYPDDNE